MTRFSQVSGVRCATPLRLVAAMVLALGSALVVVEGAIARDGKDGRGEVRVAGSCSAGVTSKLKLKSRDGGIELGFEVDHNRAGALWRVAIVHERRVVWRGAAKTSGPSGSFDVERRLPDLVGTDTVTARAWGPAGVTCRATATLPGP
jgi:hypothetical protein